MNENKKTMYVFSTLLIFSAIINTKNPVSDVILEKSNYLNIENYEQLATTVGMGFNISEYNFPLIEPIITSKYGMRIHPITLVTQMHNGVDLFSNISDDVFAIADGILYDSGYSESYGNYVILEHFDGKKSLYAHLSEIEIKNYYNKGEILGYMGNTGQTTSKHLHFEIWKEDVPINPLIELNLYEN